MLIPERHVDASLTGPWVSVGGHCLIVMILLFGSRFLGGTVGTLYPVKKCIGVTVLVLAILAQDGYFLLAPVKCTGASYTVGIFCLFRIFACNRWLNAYLAFVALGSFFLLCLFW